MKKESFWVSELRQLAGYFLLTPLVLGGFLFYFVYLGSVKSYRTNVRFDQELSSYSRSMKDLDNVVADLHVLSKLLLRMNQNGTDFMMQVQLVEKASNLWNKIDTEIRPQFNSDSQVLRNAWNDLSKTLLPQLVNIANRQMDSRNLDYKVSILIDTLEDQRASARTLFKIEQSRMQEYSQMLRWSFIMAILGSACFGILIGLLAFKATRNIFAKVLTGRFEAETIFDSLDEGVLIFGRNGIIEFQSSEYILKLFGSSLVGRMFGEVLPLSSKEKERVGQWVRSLFEVGSMSFSDLTAESPHALELNGRWVVLRFSPIYDSSEQKLNKVACIISDKTEERNLGGALESSKNLNQLMSLVLSDREAFLEFILAAKASFIDLFEGCHRTEPRLDLLFRNIQILKGGSVTFNLDFLLKEVLFLEDLISRIDLNHSQELMESLDHIQDEIVRVRDKFESFLKQHGSFLGSLEGKSSLSRTISVSLITEMGQFLVMEHGENSPSVSAFRKYFIQTDIGVEFKRFEPMIFSMAECQIKKVEFKIETGKVFADVSPYRSLIASLDHAFQNSVDHGIEDPVLRVENGKSVIGTIEVKFNVLPACDGKQSLLQIQVIDDGRGVDLELVRAKAVERGFLSKTDAKNLSESEAFQILFLVGFSLRDSISEFSGRGMGLDLIMHEASKLGGVAWIESEEGKGTRLVVEVPYGLA